MEQGLQRPRERQDAAAALALWGERAKIGEEQMAGGISGPGGASAVVMSRVSGLIT